MLRRLKILAVMVVILLFAAQLYRPERTNPYADPKQGIHAILTTDPQVVSVMKRSCNDCHSNQTVWPWYSKVAPASWLVVSDVNRGRAAANFSEWSKYSPQEQQKRLEKICSEISDGEMPALQYTLMHPSARLTAAQKSAVCQWTEGLAGPKSDRVAEE